MIDVTSNSGWLSCTLRIVHIIQMIIQGQWLNQSDLLTVPHVNLSSLSSIKKVIVRQCQPGCSTATLFGLRMVQPRKQFRLEDLFMEVLSEKSAIEAKAFVCDLPIIHIAIRVADQNTGNKVEVNLNSSEPYTMAADADIEFEIDLHRIGAENMTVHSKKFPKQKDESWILLLGVPDEDELLAMKRIMVKRTASANLRIKVPNKKGSFANFALWVAVS